MKKNKLSEKNSLIENIKNKDFLPDHVVVSAIQGLSHFAELDWEAVLLPLLDSHNKIIAGNALSALCNHYNQRKKLSEKITNYASTYLPEETDNELQFVAILQLEILATENSSFYKKLQEIAENYTSLQGGSDTVLMNTTAWESLAKLSGINFSKGDKNELYLNPQSEGSDVIRSRIRKRFI
jgi:hypothetical protein